MATDPVTAGSQRALADEHAAAPTSPAAGVSRATLIGLVGSLTLGPAVLLAALSGHFEVVLALVVLVAFIVAGFLSGMRSFVHLFVLACVLRPIVDLAASPRTSGVSATEAFGLGVLTIMGGWLFLHRAELAPRLLRPLPLSLAALVVVQALAALGSVAPGDGIAATLRMAAGLAVFLITDLLLATGRLSFRQVALLVAGVSVMPLLYPLLGFVGVTVTTRKDDVMALKSVFYLSNNFAYFLVPLVVLGTAWSLRASGITRVAAVVFTAVVGVELILTETRGAWLCAAIGALIVCLLLDRRAAMLALVGVVLAAIFVPSVNARIADLVPDPDQPRTQSSLAWRFGQWEGLLPSIQSSPVLGGGPGEALRLTGKEAHNDYLRSLVETGIIGLGIYLWVLYAMLATAWRAFARVGGFRRRPTVHEPLLVATLAAVAAYAVAIAVASAGDNLIDNVTFLWSTLPLMAIAQWALGASNDQVEDHDDDPLGEALDDVLDERGLRSAHE